MATITTQYGVGDVVYIVVDASATTPVTCPACSSTGKVTLSGGQYTCPACQGQKQKGPKTKTAVAMEVTKVLATRCSRACRVVYEGSAQGYGRQTRREDELFATQAAALASIGG